MLASSPCTLVLTLPLTVCAGLSKKQDYCFCASLYCISLFVCLCPPLNSEFLWEELDYTPSLSDLRTQISQFLQQDKNEENSCVDGETEAQSSKVICPTAHRATRTTVFWLLIQDLFLQPTASQAAAPDRGFGRQKGISLFSLEGWKHDY